MRGRAANQQSGSQGGPALPIAIALLAILAFTPIGLTGWIGVPAHVAKVVFTPIARPLYSVAGWLTHRVRGGPAVSDLEQLDAENRLLRQNVRREQAENDRLRELIAELQAGVPFAPRSAFTRLSRPVVLASSDPSSGVLSVRAGGRDGVTDGTVATVRGTQLLGRVVDVSLSISAVRPITDDAAGLIEGAVFLTEDDARRLSCSLRPDGERLRGFVEFVASADANTEPIRPAVGDTVRLDDPAWPDSAQMLELGRVITIEDSPEQPLRSVITVEPVVDLRRVTRVVLRIPVEADDPEAGP